LSTILSVFEIARNSFVRILRGPDGSHEKSAEGLVYKVQVSRRTHGITADSEKPLRVLITQAPTSFMQIRFPSQSLRCFFRSSSGEVMLYFYNLVDILLL
jgi:hypothetical protein